MKFFSNAELKALGFYWEYPGYWAALGRDGYMYGLDAGGDDWGSAAGIAPINVRRHTDDGDYLDERPVTSAAAFVKWARATLKTNVGGKTRTRSRRSWGASVPGPHARKRKRAEMHQHFMNFTHTEHRRRRRAAEGSSNPAARLIAACEALKTAWKE